MNILLFLMMFVIFPQETNENSIEVEPFEIVTLTTYKSVGSETDSFPEYYHSVGFEFVGVSQIMFDSNSLSPCKFMMFRCRNTGVVVQGEMIYDNHPMWDYNTI